MKHVLVIRTIPEENKWYHNDTFLNFFLLLKNWSFPKSGEALNIKPRYVITKNEKEEDDMDFA